MLYKQSYELIEDLIIDIKKPFNNICIHGYYPQIIIQHLIKHRNSLIDRSIIKSNNINSNQMSIMNNNMNNNNNTDTISNNTDTINKNTNKFNNNTNNSINSQQQQFLLPSIKIIDYLDILQQQTYKNNTFNTQIVKLQSSEQFLYQQNKFDLIISCLQLHHCNNQQQLLQKYLRTLKPDGALIGCAISEGTLSELHWSYLMAQNQRYGGLSPKIMGFPSLGKIGNMLTSTHYHLTTVLNRDYQLVFDSVMDVIKGVQIIGESGWLKGRRKGVYEDLLIAMYALYQAEFTVKSQHAIEGKIEGNHNNNNHNNNHNNNTQNKLDSIYNSNKQQKVISTLVLAPFVGWKYSPDQRKPLKRGQVPQSIDFINQLKKHDPDLQHFRISEQSDQPENMNKK